MEPAKKFIAVIEFDGWLNEGDMPLQQRITKVFNTSNYGFAVEHVAVVEVTDEAGIASYSTRNRSLVTVPLVGVPAAELSEESIQSIEKFIKANRCSPSHKVAFEPTIPPQMNVETDNIFHDVLERLTDVVRAEVEAVEGNGGTEKITAALLALKPGDVPPDVEKDINQIKLGLKLLGLEPKR